VPLFSQQQLQAVLNALQVVRFGQRLQLPGPWGLLAEARPAGSSIGAAVWTLTAGSQR
jgi:Cft2 family RNA processing exonuclease